MRGLVCGIALVLLASCSTSSHPKTTTPAKKSPCPLIAQLDATAASVAHADVADPDAWTRTRNAAVQKYVDTVRELKDVAPASLTPDLDRMEAAVSQYRFQDALTARTALAQYADSTCGAAQATTTTTAP